MGDVTSLVIVDDHPVVAAGVAAWCAVASPPLRVVVAAADPSAAWLPPGDTADVVVLDLQLRSRTAPAWGDLRRLADAGRRVVVHSMRDDGDTILRCLDLGAITYVTKAEGERHLVAAVHAAAADRPYTAPAAAGAMLADLDPTRPKLAPRETQVLLEWFRCESKELVARKLNLSPRTVAGYLDRVRIKYANAGRPATTKAALVARALQDGLVSVDDL